MKKGKLTNAQVKDQGSLEDQIESLELHEMSEAQVERVIKGFSPEARELRANRKKIRYQLYRLRTEAEGKNSAESKDKFRKSFEKQPLFDGWRFFAVTWDVAFDDPNRIIHKDKSEQEEWDELVRAKFPVILAGGRVEYPDITVKKRVDAEIEKRKKK